MRQTAKEQGGVEELFKPKGSARIGALDSFASFVHGDAVGMK
jgi:hypothetical protein